MPLYTGRCSLRTSRAASLILQRHWPRAVASPAPNSRHLVYPAGRMPAMARAVPPSAELVQDGIVWAIQHGLVYGLGDDAPDGHVVHAPFALLPCPYPREQFQKAQEAMCAFSRLVDEVSKDEVYLEETLAQAAQHDSFTAQLLQVLRDTRAHRSSQAATALTLGVHRSDYMLDAPSGRLMQVELNTIASSFGCLSTLTAQLHKYLLSRVEAPDMPLDSLPSNDATEGIAAALALAVAAYGKKGAVVVMVVQPGERNAFDQQWLQTTLWEQHRVRTLRRTLLDIQTEAAVTDSGDLLVDGHVAAVVYFRAGYTPDDYPSGLEWQARVKLEECRAAKCPSVAYQLAGAKKIQQDLAKPGQLERFVTNPQEAALLRSFFAGLWSLDDLQDGATRDIVCQALAAPEDFVLKPQREGGGNNLYGAELQAKLQGGTGLSAYILMQRIKPQPNRSTLVRGGKWTESETLSELGIYGTFLREGDNEMLNQTVGHLVRTKTASSNEGGVAAGFAVLDSPYLV